MRKRKKKPVDLLLVDGKNTLYRNADRLRELTHEGTPTGGVFGFLKSVSAVHNEWGGEVIVCWEGRGLNFRKSLFPAYKQRDEPDEELREFLNGLRVQEKILWRILRLNGVAQYLGKNCEADDVLGTLARRAERRGERVLILTGDSDLRQVVTNKVSVLAPGFGGGEPTLYEPAEVVRKHGVSPEALAALKALAGDTSDKIPGLKGIGQKTAQALVNTYGTIEGVIKGAETGKRWPVAERFRKVVSQERETLELFHKLTTVDTKAALIRRRPAPNPKALRREFLKYGLNSFATRSDPWLFSRSG